MEYPNKLITGDRRYHHAIIFRIDVSSVKHDDIPSYMTNAVDKLTKKDDGSTLDDQGFLCFFIPVREGGTTLEFVNL